jgi:hypothetical protein
LIVLRRKVRGRARLTNNDRWFFIQLYRWFPSTLQVLTIICPETLVRWHRAGFRCYWRWKSPYSTKQGIISAEQGILAQEQGILPANRKSSPDEIFDTHRLDSAPISDKLRVDLGRPFNT